MKNKKQDKTTQSKATKGKKLSNGRNWFIGLLHDRTFQRVLILLLISKILIFGFGTFAQVYYPKDRPYYVVDNWFLNGWAQYDGKAYLSIVTDGYNRNFNGSGNTAWFPLYPMLIKGLGVFFGGTPDGYALAGFIISNMLFVIAMFFLFKLVEEELNSKKALRVCTYLLFFPTAFFFSAVYAESLFFLLTVGAFYYANKRMWLWAGIFGFLSSLTRTFGVLLFVPFVYMYLKDRDFDFKRINYKILWVCLVPLGLLVYLSYLWVVFGSPFVFVQGHEQYGRYTSLPWVPLFNSVKILLSALAQNNFFIALYQIYNLLITASFIAAAWVLYRMKKTAYAVYMTLTLLLILISASLEGISREIIVVFPMFIALAHTAENRKYNKIITAMFIVFGVLLIVFTIRHLTAYLLPGISIA